MAEESIEDRISQITEDNGSADWHLSANYEDDDLTQNFSVRPDYDYDERPLDGEVVLHALRNDAETFGEAELTVSTREFARICRQFLGMLHADQAAYDHAAQPEVEEEPEEDEGEDDETPEDDEGAEDGSEPEDPEDA
jgi:hypothetical protein